MSPSALAEFAQDSGPTLHPQPEHGEEEVRALLRSRTGPHPLAPVLVELLASALVGGSVLPQNLGLSLAQERLLFEASLGEESIPEKVCSTLIKHLGDSKLFVLAEKRAALREILLDSRRGEVEALQTLLEEYADETTPLALVLARVVALGCLGGAHLYRDLGLRNRAELRELLAYGFPRLVKKNTRDMRWKKFFYRSLCEAGGDYLCRSPTCEDCSSHSECFHSST